MIYGIDVLAGARYPKMVLNQVPAGWALGFFWDTFGPVAGLLHKVAKKRTMPLIGDYKFPLVRVQGVWRDDHNFPKTDDTKAIEIARQYNKIAAQYPHVTWQYSPFCEYDGRISKERLEKLFDRIREVAPKLELVCTPYGNGVFIKGVIAEWHHSNPPPPENRPCQFSYDGLSSFDSDIETAKSKAISRDAKVFFFWWWQLNLKMNFGDKTPRPQRKAFPNKQQFKTALTISTTKVVDSLLKSWLWKAVSEQHKSPVPDPDDIKPVVIGPTKGTIKIKSGDKTITFDQPVPDAHNPGDWVYRTRQVYACELTRPVDVLFNNVYIGQIDPCFRSSKKYIEDDN